MKHYIDGYNDSGYMFKLAHHGALHLEYMKNGYNHIFCDGGEYKLYTYDGYIPMPAGTEKLFDIYGEDDVLSIDERGIVYEQYRASSDDNAIVCTLQCNSNCIMCPCSERSRRESRLCSFEDLQELLRYIPKSARFLTITGGEPTLLKEDFFSLMSALRGGYDETGFLLLTNGRAFGDYRFAKRFAACMPDNMRVGIPLYGYNETAHDRITQTKGSFQQTVIGIQNLLHYGVETEIRVVLTKQTIDAIDGIAAYIIKYFPGIACVNLMGLEMMGNAAKNRELVWLPYRQIFEKSKCAVKRLIVNGIDAKLYNFPLCAVDKSYWEICAKSISDYKVDYSGECEGCDVKEICGGVFDSTKRVVHFTGSPIKRCSDAELF